VVVGGAAEPTSLAYDRHIEAATSGGAVAVITEAAIRELASIRGEGTAITSCYLDVDGRRVARYLDLEQEVERLLRGAKVQANGDPSVHADLRRIERLVRGGIDRSRTRGLAIFACSAQDLWRVIELPVPVHNQLVINQVPSVGQLESILREHLPVGVLMADRQRARMFVFALGELVEHSERFDALPRDEDVRGERDRGGDRPQHVAAKVERHLRHAAQVAFDVWQSNRFDHLVIAAPDDLISTLEVALHPYLRERLAGRANLPVPSSHDQVLAEAQSMEAAVERKRQAAIVERLRAEVASGRRGVAGLGPTLEALNDHRIDQLVVSKGFRAPGWRCDDCSIHVAMGRACKRCGDEMVMIDDVVEEAVEAALARSTRVEICIGNADLDVMGRIGALLRF
jgi:peptide chain release factor subunit 1